MHKETKRTYGFTCLGVGVSFLLAVFAHVSLLFAAVPLLVAATVFLVSYHRDQIKENKKKEQIDRFIEWGQGLLNDAPEDDAEQTDIDDWKKYHNKWVEGTWVYLQGAAPRAADKFSYIPRIDPKPHSGAHESIHYEIDLVYKRMDMLREILEKPDVYLSD